MSSIGNYDDGTDDGSWGSDSREMQIFIPSDLNTELFQGTYSCCKPKRKIVGNLICSFIVSSNSPI